MGEVAGGKGLDESNVEQSRSPTHHMLVLFGKMSYGIVGPLEKKREERQVIEDLQVQSAAVKRQVGVWVWVCGCGAGGRGVAWLVISKTRRQS